MNPIETLPRAGDRVAGGDSWFREAGEAGEG